MKLLKIAATQNIIFFLGSQDRKVTLLSSETDMAEIAVIVKLKGETIAEDIRQNLDQSGLKIPVVDMDMKNKQQIQQIEKNC